MDRRNFIKASLTGAAGIMLGEDLFAQDVRAGAIVPGEVYTDGRPGNVSTGVEDHLKIEGYVKEPSHKIPVVASADVVVAGGGAAGFAAAIAAAREGASVILVERMNYLGGLWTGGLVLPVLATHARGKTGEWERNTGGICLEICGELLAKGWAINPDNPRVDPEATKYLLDLKLKEAGVKVIYNAYVSGALMSADRLDSVILNCNTGRLALKCRQVVDATGDGAVFAFAGDPYEARRYHINDTCRIGGSRSTKLGGLTPNPMVHTKGFGSRQAEDGLDIFRVSELQRDHRIEAWNWFQKKARDPECEGAFFIEMAPTTGIRVTRVLDSLCNVTLEGSMEWQSYDDCIGMGGICDPFNYKGRRVTKKDRPVWQIPYRSLLPRQTKNLLVAGRCFGYDQGITWDAREISTCFVTGQAAGTAAAMASIGRSSTADIDIKDLQKKLRAGNVRLDF